MRSSSGMNAASAFKQRRLAGAGAAGDQDVLPRSRRPAGASARASGASVPIADQFSARVALAVKFPDGENRAGDRAGRKDGRHARAVRQPGVEERLFFADVIPKHPGDVAHGDLQAISRGWSTSGHAPACRPCFSTKTPAEPLTRMSEISGSRIRASIGRRNGMMTSQLIDFSFGELLEVGRVLVEVVRLQVAVGGRMRIQAVVGQDDRLRVLEFRENLRLKDEVALDVVALARARRWRGAQSPGR